MLKKLFFGIFLLLALAGLARLFAPNWYNFLSMNAPLSDAEVLIVEGWVSENTLKHAAELYHQGKYKKIITASINLENEFYLHSKGGLVYEVGQMNMPAYNTVTVWAHSPMVGGEHGKLLLMADTDTLGEVETKAQLQAYSFPLTLNSDSIQQIKVIFTNDFYDFEEQKDRNVYIHSLYLDSTFIPNRTSLVHYDRGKIDGERLQAVHKSRAGSSADILIEHGVPAEQIQIIDAPRVKYNKTYTTADAVAEWMEEYVQEELRVNLISEHLHARRSWLLFRKALPDRVKLGVISSSGSHQDAADYWWKEEEHSAYVIDQTMKFWYAIASYYFI
ncbi:carbohydrate-binding domain-containing protein [Porifericola rhodea]|uniref:carbohydrate-binding domain-containing protein n=1 Tax=Porifericola rhodea TaxID=930972 RepID=UPI002665E072|nr:carbohydrate-binding domain-containing protein [Porifericola rhodea]WKN29859.1 carbohydrate-binding domain-containing protein [Porifericola rhodea]